MRVTRKYVNELTYKVLGCAIEVHRHVGPGLIESVYEKCFVKELALRGLQYKKQLCVPMEYKGLSLEAELRLDVIVEDILCVELKAIEGLLPIHEAILMTYMRMLQKPKGILINFNCKNIFKYGQKTLVNELFTALPNE
jgi:GxxExxY protein